VTRLRASPSGQVYDIDLGHLKITPDQGGGYVLHGKGVFLQFEKREQADARKKELEYHAPG
jgi:hypothetical protein